MPFRGGGVSTPNGKCHLKFPFWLSAPVPDQLTMMYFEQSREARSSCILWSSSFFHGKMIRLCVLVCKAIMCFVDDDWMMMGDWTIWRISWIYIPNTSRMFCLTKSIIKFFALSMIHQSVRVVFFSPNFVKWIHFTFNVNVSGKTSSFYGFSGGCLFHQSGNTKLTNKSCSHYSNLILMIARVQ